MPSFRDLYAQLNAEQQTAVDAIEGPLLVIAGPGTGKTQLLSLRAATILKKTDADPSNILCLTFTNKAALNMQERLLQLIGPEARHVVVRTFHSLAADIMNHYPDFFWEGAQLSVAPDVVQDDILTDILSTLPHNHPLASKFGGTFTAINDIKRAMQLAKESGLTPEALRDIAAQNAAYIDTIEPKLIAAIPERLSSTKLPKLSSDISRLPAQDISQNRAVIPLDQVIIESLSQAIADDEGTNKTKHTGKWKQRWLQTIDGDKKMNKERERNAWWLAVAEVYQTYRQQLHERGYYDYADMLVEVLTQLSKHKDMLANLQETYQYIMIDEFQDTNAAQFQLADTIASHPSSNNRPNIMAVGDDDQAIFTFQGAELSNVTNFYERYQDTKLVVLTENYRSTEKVLDTAAGIIELAQQRLIDRLPHLTKDLHANQDSAQSRITHYRYPTSEHQYSAIAHLIQKQWSKGENDIAVLARKHSSLEDISSQLNALGVPVRYERQSNVLEQPAVMQILLLADATVAFAQGDQKALNVHLSRLIRHPMWNIPPKTLWRLAKENYSQPDWYASMLEHPDKRVRHIAEGISSLARQSDNLPLPKVIDILLGIGELESFKSPIRDYYIQNQELTADYVDMLSGLSIIRAMVKEFASKAATLEDFVRFIELNRTNDKKIPNESWYQTHEQAVNLLTVHSAKGLEFDTVYVIDALDTHWKPRRQGRTAPSNFSMQPYGENPDDYVRLMYVAATRAKRNFIAASPELNETGKELLPTPLLSKLPTEKGKLSNIKPVDVLETKMQWPRIPISNQRDILADRLEGFALSASALLDFLDITEAGPESFKERWLLRLPREQTVPGSYGNAIHGALQTAQRLMNESNFTLAPVLDRYESELTKQFLAPQDIIRLRQQGQELLERLLKSPEHVLTPGAKAEITLETSLPGKARLKGSIDKLIVTKDTVTIVDYKTGQPLPSLDTKNKQMIHKAWKHRTQLQFYALLAKQQPDMRHKDIHTQLMYLESDKDTPHVIDYRPSEEELTQLQQLIEIIWPMIQKLQLPTVTDYPQSHEGVLLFQQALLKEQGNNE